MMSPPRFGETLTFVVPRVIRRPRATDIEMTRSLWNAKPLGISVHDHIIVGKEGHASFKGLKLI
jgi:DNA repair protein RadC